MKLSRSSLDWAKVHILKEGDTDLFPRPFEIDILNEPLIWNEVAQKLMEEDIENYEWKEFRSLLIPKDELSFRRAVQLDPLDSIMLLAMVKTIGLNIEKSRPAPKRNVVFSYRFDPKADGQLYDRKDGWKAFWQEGIERAQRSSYVLVTDLTDFYNQIYHHNIENMFEVCKISGEFRDSIMKLFKAVSFGVSRGVPVGPHATHIIAEMSMIPIDDFMYEASYSYIRYVDDIHLFFDSKKEAEFALYGLAKILDIHQKILPNRHKTRIISATEYIGEAEEKLKDKPINSVEEDMLKVLGGITRNPYEKRSYLDIPEAERFKFSEQNISSVLDAYLACETIDFPRLRWLLRRFGQFGIPEAVGPVIERLNQLHAALPDVALYLKEAQQSYAGDWSDIGESLIQILDDPIVKNSEYLSMVILGLFSKITPLNHVAKLTSRFESLPPYSKRKVILIANNAGNSSWIRSIRDKYNQLDPWSKRAMIFAYKKLPTDERHYWLKNQKPGNTLDDAIIRFADS